MAEQLAPLSDTPRLDTELLLGAAIARSRTWLFTWPDHQIDSPQLATFLEYFQRRKSGEPVAYILGEKEFWSLPLAVDSSTLIPRPDTELLVATVIDLPHSKNSILDLGTGTGAIALALASELKTAEIIAVDKYPQAVSLARLNLQRLGFNNVKIMQSDWFAALEGQRFDVIVSNPPYVDGGDPHLSRGDVRFEPLTALVAEDKGLADIRHIITRSVGYLNNGGYLLLEHGWQQDEVVAKIFVGKGFKNVRTLKDLGGNNRVTLGVFDER